MEELQRQEPLEEGENSQNWRQRKSEEPARKDAPGLHGVPPCVGLLSDGEMAQPRVERVVVLLVDSFDFDQPAALVGPGLVVSLPGLLDVNHPVPDGNQVAPKVAGAREAAGPEGLAEHVLQKGGRRRNGDALDELHNVSDLLDNPRVHALTVDGADFAPIKTPQLLVSLLVKGTHSPVGVPDVELTQPGIPRSGPGGGTRRQLGVHLVDGTGNVAASVKVERHDGGVPGPLQVDAFQEGGAEGRKVDNVPDVDLKQVALVLLVDAVDVPIVAGHQMAPALELRLSAAAGALPPVGPVGAVGMAGFAVLPAEAVPRGVVQRADVLGGVDVGLLDVQQAVGEPRHPPNVPREVGAVREPLSVQNNERHLPRTFFIGARRKRSVPPTGQTHAWHRVKAVAPIGIPPGGVTGGVFVHVRIVRVSLPVRLRSDPEAEVQPRGGLVDPEAKATAAGRSRDK
ncbi:glycosyltransferase family 1 protein [Babesia caballi]|uniref:Glycosyltransferase family 1 protein n=1 Tax=Babesia caballi TaxID=5871 RepID=A0AAV4LRK9_BABCB|nr:glycosyltransferase family 1 protein [Babesia caballi]